MTKSRQDQTRGSHLLGMGLDDTDGHQRITRGENMLLVGGSSETHERMQEHAIKLNETLASRGKTLRDCDVEEATEAFREVVDKCQ